MIGASVRTIAGPAEIAAILPAELARGAFAVGLARYAAARARGGKHRWGYAPTPAEGRFNDGMAAVTERLVAAATGRAWTSDGLVPDPPHAGDVAGGISVRWRPRHGSPLIVYADERENLRSVLVTGPIYPDLEIVGFVYVRDAHATPQYWRDEGAARFPAFFIPQRSLLWHPIEELRA